MRMHSTSNPPGEPHPDSLGLLHARLVMECGVAHAARVNLLLVGPHSVTESVVRALWRGDHAHTWSPGRPLNLPPGGGLLILHDVGHLSHEDQRRLWQWLESEFTRAQVVSTSRSPLTHRLAAGAFDEALYYRLNTICINASDL